MSNFVSLALFMRSNRWLPGFLLLLSCTAKKPSTQKYAEAPQDVVDSVLTNSEIPLLDQNDSLTYIGFVGKYDDNVFYTELYFADGYGLKNYEEIKGAREQLMYEGSEFRRTKLRLEKVAKYFDLSGLENVVIYDSQNRIVARGQFSHIEFVEDMIEDKFVAVFDVDNPKTTDYSFCVGNAIVDLKPMLVREIRDTQVTSTILQSLGPDSSNIWHTSSFEVGTDGLMYTIYSADTTSYIIETVNGVSQTLYQSKFNEAISLIAILSKAINEHPILLIQSGMPETDLMWSSLLVFDKKQYVRLERGRIHTANW